METRRRNNKMDMTVSEQLQFIKDQMCLCYCRYSEKLIEGKMKRDVLEGEYCKYCALKEI